MIYQLLRRMLRGLAVLAIVVGVPAQVAAASGAPKHLAPPGNSALTQYLEDVPNAAGSSPPGSGGSSSPSPTLSASRTTHLEHLGSTGKLIVAVDKSTAPSITTKSAIHLPNSTSSAGRGSPVSAVLGAAAGSGGGGGMGLLLPLLIGGGLLSVAISVTLRRRARGS